MHEKVEKRLFLIDGYGFVFRAFHSLPPLTNPAGQPVGAVYGFTNMLIKLKNRFESVNAEEIYIICVFDAGKQTFRQELYADYKANRPEPPDDLRPQFPMVRDVAKAMCIESVELSGFEADDIIATYTRMAQEQGMHVTIVSSDKDLMQLVNDDVKMYDSLREKIIGTDQVKEKFGVSPTSVLDVLSLMGDSSDNIPGVKGIGPKTAAELINQFGDLDGIYNNLESITKKKVKENLETYRNEAFLSRELARLKNDVDVEQDMSKFRMKPNDMQVLVPFLNENGFKSLAARVITKNDKVNSTGAQNYVPTKNNDFFKDLSDKQYAADKGAAARAALTPPAPAAPRKADEITEITSRAQLAGWLPSLPNAKNIAAYFIYNVLGEVETISLAKSNHQACIVKNSSGDKENSRPGDTGKPQHDLFSAGPKVSDHFAEYFEVLAPFVQSGSCNFIMHDAKKLFKTRRKLINELVAFDDIGAMNYSLNGTVVSSSLEGIAKKYLGETPVAGREALEIFELHAILEQEIFDQKSNYIYYDVERPLIKVLAEMEIEGIKIDEKILSGLSVEFGDKVKILEKEIFALAGEEFNVGSSKQLGEVLFEHMGIQGGKKTKAGNYTTDSDALEGLSEQGHSIADKVLEWRSFSKLINTYTNALGNSKDARTGRVHTTFNQTATTTGRLSSTDPNLQNIPIRSEEGRKIRAAFIADTGCKLISIDYSQIELRLLAHVANMEVLRAAFREGKDIHAATASQVFGIDIKDVSAEMRRRAKTVNFGIIYGQGAFGLASQLGISRGEAKTLIEKYFQQYPGIKKYMEDWILIAHEKGYVSTLWGRKIHLPGINDRNGAVRSFNERAAINAPLQGTAADIIKRAMIVLDAEFKKQNLPAKILLQIHDELIIEVKENAAEITAALAKKVMEQVIFLSVPLIADPNTGNSWADIH